MRRDDTRILIAYFSAIKINVFLVLSPTFLQVYSRWLQVQLASYVGMTPSLATL